MPEQRFELYRPIHKAVRHLSFSAAHAVGVADFKDEEAPRQALEKLERTIAMLREHAGHENDFVHPALESRVPGITAPFDGNHEDDEQVYAQLEQLARQMRASGGDRQVALGNQVYGIFNKFVGDYLGHLDHEEHELEQAFLDHFTDEELIAIHEAIMGSVAPERMGEWLTEICSSFNPDELTMILGSMKAGAPPEVIEWAFQLAERTMPPGTAEKVKARLT